jgi:hypothetical protein
MSLLDIDNLLSGMVPELVRKRWILVLQPAPQQLAALRLGCRHGVLVIAEQQSRRCAAGEFAILKRMGKPVTLLEQLCGHAMSFGARSFETERKDGWQRAFAQIDDARTRIANFEDSSTDAKELRANLYAATKKPFRTVIGGKVYVLQVRVVESFGEDAFEVSIDPAPKLDPCVVPPFTAKQGQYLAFVYNYTKIQLPASGVGPAVLLQGLPSCDPRYDQDPGAQRAHRKTTWAGALHSPPCRSGVPAAIEVVRAMKPTTVEASAEAPHRCACPVEAVGNGLRANRKLGRAANWT